MEGSSWVRSMFETGLALKREHGEENVCDFSLGNPDLEPPANFRQTLIALLEDKKAHQHGYMPNGGFPEVRASIASYVSKEYAVDVTGRHVLMSCGAAGALNVVLKSILDPGDNVLACTPCFMEYKAYAENHGGEMRFVPGTEAFDLNVSGLDAAIDERTAALIINSPNNPTGRIYPAKTLQDLAAMLEERSRKRGKAIYVISDEPYRHIVYTETDVPSILQYYSNSIVVNSYSKELSIPGERIGWIAVHPESEACPDLLNALVLSTRILGYVNAPALMQRAVAALTGESVDVAPYAERRALLCDSLRDAGYEVARPEGAFYAFPKAPGGDDLAFTRALQEERILTVPGRGFGAPGYFRIAFCVDRSVIERALPGFEKVRRHFR